MMIFVDPINTTTANNKNGKKQQRNVSQQNYDWRLETHKRQNE